MRLTTGELKKTFYNANWDIYFNITVKSRIPTSL